MINAASEWSTVDLYGRHCYIVAARNCVSSVLLLISPFIMEILVSVILFKLYSVAVFLLKLIPKVVSTIRVFLFCFVFLFF
jgi:hypothetical protein